MSSDLSKTYEPREIEKQTYAAWIDAGVFDAEPDQPGASYTIVIPPPNVTAPLHLGHALNNSLQDILIRFKRMQQNNTLWMPGTDHAGIATQTVVEKRILAQENRWRTDFEREELLTGLVRPHKFAILICRKCGIRQSVGKVVQPCIFVRGPAQADGRLQRAPSHGMGRLRSACRVVRDPDR